MKQKIKAEFEKADYLSFQEFRVLKKYASEPTANSEMIAKSLLLEKATVDAYNKRILKKLEDIFYRRFGNARSAAAFLKRAGLI